MPYLTNVREVIYKSVKFKWWVSAFCHLIYPAIGNKLDELTSYMIMTYHTVQFLSAAASRAYKKIKVFSVPFTSCHFPLPRSAKTCH